MAILQTIRVQLGVFVSIVIALALLGFLIGDFLRGGPSSSKTKVGEINGETISYEEFTAKVDEYEQINQIMSGQASRTEEEHDQIRSAAWQSFLEKYLFMKNARAAGINVGTAEVIDLTTGDMMSPLISQNPAFLDENGDFSMDNLVEFTNAVQSDQSGNLKLYWDYLQNTVYSRQFYSKYGSLFTQSAYVNPLMLTRSIEENNNTSDIEFIMMPLGYERDSTISVTNKEIIKYYKDHKHLYKQTASREIEYVVFEVVPSAEDIQEATVQANELHDEFIETDNVKSFLLKNSDRQYSDYYYKEGELATISADIDNFVFGEGDPIDSPLYKRDNVFYAAKVLDTRMVPDSVYVRHILLQGDDEEKADSLMTVLKKGGNFAVLAAQYSADQNSALSNQGEIGWLTQNYMIQGMESVMTAKAGTPFIMDTQYGKHIVEITKTSKPLKKKQVAIFERAILPSKATYNDYYSLANEFAVAADGKYENYLAAVAEKGLYSHTEDELLENTSRFGAIDNAREVTRWAFDAKKGKVSSVITVNNNYFFVVAVKEVHKEGYATVQEKAAAINNILYAEKAGEKLAAEVAEKMEGLGSMQAIADALGAIISTRENITFSSLTSQSLDAKLVGAVSVAEPGVISKPLVGDLGVYVYRVTDRDTGAFYTEDDAKTANDQKVQYNLQVLVNVMAEDANVIDHRARFF